MKILHLVTLVSRDGAYGGPLRVALNQAAELNGRGHEVHLGAAWRGSGDMPRSVEGVPAFLFPARALVPARGFSGLVSPGLARWLFHNVRDYDVVHIHAGRDLISVSSMAIVSRLGRPYVTQTHGMIQPDRRPATQVMDVALVRRLLRLAGRRFVLTDVEKAGLVEVLGPGAKLERLVNGVPEVAGELRQPSRDVLYCARLQERKRPVAFVELADRLRRRGINAQFSLVGPDEGEVGAVQRRIVELGLESTVRYEGSLDYGDVLGRMRAAAVYVLPSVNEPFPMSLLEALSLGIPSVCTDTCGVADALREGHAALVTDGTVEAMAEAVAAILSDQQLSAELSVGARQVVREQFSMQAVGDQLEHVYRQVADRVSSPPAA